MKRAKEHSRQGGLRKPLFLGKEGHNYEYEHHDEHNPLKKTEDSAGDPVEPAQSDHLEGLGQQVADQSDGQHNQERDQQERDGIGNCRNTDQGQQQGRDPAVIPGSDAQAQD